MKGFKLWDRPQDVPPATTITGLVEMGRRWVAREVSDKSLAASLDTVAARVSAGADQTRTEMSSIVLAEVLQEPATRAVEALVHVLQAIDAMREALRTKADMEEALALLSAGAEAFGREQAIIDAHKRAKVAACPRCGRRQSAGEWDCNVCHIHLVIPDRSGNSFPAVTVGPQYAAVYRACDAVMDGHITIEAFLSQLHPLESQLLQMATFATQALENVGDAASASAARDLQAIHEQIELTREGLDRLRRFEDSHAAADLNTGWGWIARAAINLQQLLPSMQQLADTLVAAQQPGESFAAPHLDIHDQVLIGAEDE